VEKDTDYQTKFLVMITIQYLEMAVIVTVKLKSFGNVKEETKLNLIIAGIQDHL